MTAYGNSVKADTVKSGSNGFQTVVKNSDAAIKGSDAVVKTDAESAPEGQNQTPEAVKKDSGAITQDIGQKAVKASEAVAKLQNNAVKDNSDAAGGKAEQSNNSSVVQEDSSAKGDSLADKNNALKAKVEAAKKAAAVLFRADSSETTLNLNGTNAIDPETLKEDKTETIVKADPVRGIDPIKFASNGGFDPKIWGTLDVNDWQGSVQGDYYQLNDYTGDANHVIVPNEADFEKAGISTGGKQVAVTKHFFRNSENYSKNFKKTRSLAFSKTAGKQVKAIGDDWTNAFSDYGFSKFNGENLDVSNVTIMGSMFSNCSNLSNISSLANWDTSKVTSMWHMFNGCESLSDISPLAHWDTSKVINMTSMFENCSNLSDISTLANWDTSKVDTMTSMFSNCSNLSDVSPLANWDTSKVTIMSSMFENTPLKKATLTNWDFSNINPSYGAESIFPDINFEATLSDKTSKSLLDISSKLSDSAKENIKDKQSELKQAEQEYQYYLTGDGKKEYDGQIQDLQEQFNQYKQEIQQEINQYKLQAEYPLNSVFGNHSKITTPNQDLLVYLVGKLPVKSDATRTIAITFPDGTKKTINQSVGYGKHAISGTADMATHKLDMAMPYELSKWELIKKEDGSYDLIKAHVDKNGVARFDNVDLPQIPGYKAVVKTVASPVKPARFLFAVSFMALPKPIAPVQNDTKPAETVSSATPATIEVAKPIKTEPKVIISATPKAIDLSNDAVATTPDVSTWQVADEPDHDTYHVSNDQYAVELPHISNAQLHVIANDSTKDSVLFAYKGQNSKYVFKIKFVNGHYLLTTYKIKSGKLVKLIDYNFASSAKIISVILSWFQLK